jgi:hypothetical protein
MPYKNPTKLTLQGLVKKKKKKKIKLYMIFVRYLFGM